MRRGVIEGFFGPAWPAEDRRTWATFLAEHGLDFYLYAPKADPFLRKRWREPWSASYLDELRSMAAHFRSHRIAFGVGFSPFGLGEKLSTDDRAAISEKIASLASVGVEILGIFFDDMVSTPGLAAMQIEVVTMIHRQWSGKMVFCPTYYSDDPILDKVFGTRDPAYVRDIGQRIPAGIDIAWTGPRVISDEIPVEHLVDVTARLERRPFLWDNLFANDGPKNCQFLKWKDPVGRTRESAREVAAWGLNPMNQCHLSKLVVLAVTLASREGLDAPVAFERALRALCSSALAQFVRDHRSRFQTQGLASLSESEKRVLADQARAFSEPMATEIARWLEGEFVVGSECLTD